MDIASSDGGGRWLFLIEFSKIDVLLSLIDKLGERLLHYEPRRETSEQEGVKLERERICILEIKCSDI